MDNTTHTLSEQMLKICACAALMAQGDLARLDPAIREALDGGVGVGKLKEAFSHLYAYTGFPRSLNALGLLERVLADRKAKGVADDEGTPFAPPAAWDDAKEALRIGTAMQTRLEGGTPWDYTFCPQADHYMKKHLFGDVFASEGLTPSERELVTLSALSAMNGVEPQFEGHKECAVYAGNSREQVDELCRWLEGQNADKRFRPMRRFKQQMSDEECIALLARAARGILAVHGDGGYPYTVPLDFLYSDGHIYFHCAREGHKIDAIRRNDKASFNVLSEGVKEADSWWYHFESVDCFGRVKILDDDAHSHTLLRQLGAKYFPQGYNMEDDMRKNAPHAFVLDMQIEHMTGKRVREK